jgi:hypothetical protein
MTSKKRYISKSIQKLIVKDARERCCICGHIFLPEEIKLNIEKDLLHHHHLIYISEGGKNIKENLMLVCPTCHYKIHKFPDQYPIEKLKEAKIHWKKMKDLIPEILEYESEKKFIKSDNKIKITFEIVTLNLKYEIQVHESITIEELTFFIREWIMRPIIAYERLSPFPHIFEHAQLRQMKLVKKSDQNNFLEPNKTIIDIKLSKEDTILSVIDLEHFQAMIEPKKFSAILTWNEKPSDLDLHLWIIKNNKITEIFYRNTGTINYFPFANLREDVTNGFGPEIINIEPIKDTQYYFSIYNYSNEIELAGCGAKFELQWGYEHLHFECPKNGFGRWWNILIINTEDNKMEIKNKIEKKLWKFV